MPWGHVILHVVNRRLRLVLLLAALVAAGPLPSARVFEAAGTQVTIAWVRADRPAQAHILEPRPAPHVFGIAGSLVTGSGLFVRDTLHPHSLFQRPPPFLN